MPSRLTRWPQQMLVVGIAVALGGFAGLLVAQRGEADAWGHPAVAVPCSSVAAGTAHIDPQLGRTRVLEAPVGSLWERVQDWTILLDGTGGRRNVAFLAGYERSTRWQVSRSRIQLKQLILSNQMSRASRENWLSQGHPALGEPAGTRHAWSISVPEQQVPPLPVRLRDLEGRSLEGIWRRLALGLRAQSRDEQPASLWESVAWLTNLPRIDYTQRALLVKLALETAPLRCTSSRAASSSGAFRSGPMDCQVSLDEQMRIFDLACFGRGGILPLGQLVRRRAFRGASRNM